jgi:hypothetical protein
LWNANSFHILYLLFWKGVVFFHSGYAAEVGGTDCETGADYLDRIISKSWGVVESIGDTQYELSTFVTSSAYRRNCNLEINRIGVPVHEWFHAAFDLDDLYDTGGRYNGSKFSTGGIGAFGIMAYQGGQRYDEAYPGILTPFHKMQIGALDPIEITEDGIYDARPSAIHPDVYMISAPYEDGEYLLIENRQPLLSDANMWKPGGIVIYHIDENTEGLGNFVRGGPFVEGWPGNGDHYRVAVLQADGKYQLEMALNLGHIDDFWKDGDVLGPGNGELVATDSGTYPNTDSYVDGNIRVTGLMIDLFTDEGNGEWSFRVQNLVTEAPTKAPTRLPTAAPQPSDAPVVQPSDAPVVTGPTPEPVRCFPPTFTDPSFICDCQNDCIDSADLICNCEEAVECCDAYGDTLAPAPATSPPTKAPTSAPTTAAPVTPAPTEPDATPPPTTLASKEPTAVPTKNPSKQPTKAPTKQPTMMPTKLITQSPTNDNSGKCLISVTTSQCGTLMKDFTKQGDCDCYNFCNGVEIPCCPFGNDCAVDCEGELVAGCLEPDPTPEPTPVPFVGDSCQVSVNTQNCQAVFPVDLPPVQGCDCYNFCNGQYFSCCTAGQPCGMQCEGSTVAGCAFERPDDTPAPTAAPNRAPGPSTYFFWPNGFI